MQNSPSCARVLSPTKDDTSRFRMAMGLHFGVLALICMSIAAQAQDTIKTYGVSTFGELKYGPDFKHLDYVNPDAPKGGEISFSWSSGSFDSMHPYSRKGRSAVMVQRVL